MLENLFEFIKNKNTFDIILVNDNENAVKSSHILKYFKIEHVVLPDFRAFAMDDIRSYKEEFSILLEKLSLYYEKPCKIITPHKTLQHKLPNKTHLQKIKISIGDIINLQDFKKTLFYNGYVSSQLVSLCGEVSFRGDIVDIYSPSFKHPLRISFFDNECESIRFFDELSQKSFKEEILDVEFLPALFNIDKATYELIDEQIQQSRENIIEPDFYSLAFWFLKDKINLAHNKQIYSLEKLEDTHIQYKLIEKAKSHKELKVLDVNALISAHSNKKVSILARNEAVVKAHNVKGSFSFKKSEAILNILSKDELVISLNKEETKKRQRRSKLRLDELSLNSYVVHEDYGVGIFKGLEQVQILGAKRDFVKVLYLNDDALLLPVEDLNLIDKYIAHSPPKLDKLGKSTFLKAKSKAKEKLLEIASELMSLAGKRELIKAPILSFNDVQSFLNEAGFKHTQDQEKAINDILENLAKDKPMDRLLSADVGFGKTEVAMLSAYACLRSNFQCAVVVPTTLLSAQHFKSFSQRLKGFKIARLDRFVKNKKTVLKDLEEGNVDVLIGTHSIFNAKFKKLGLVVIDEEHKFGVKQKEKLKEFYQNTHVLSMSATPIPRSLNMALSSVKELSIITTPPVYQKGVRTFVKEFDAILVKEIIQRELRRAGQIFYIFNSIALIEQKKQELLNILPKLRILILHSKIDAKKSEEELLNYENGNYDLLLCTSIIESGIHMPRVNTIIVDKSDHFGIADLHQLRGRVGRGKVEGFAYFLVDDKEAISEDAKKRLLALESSAYLGGGAELARHDLEIRGGGNMVGKSQSGHIKNIGYSLYLKMLEDSINELSGSVKKTKKQHLNINLSVSAFINDELVNDDRLRLDLHRRLASCSNKEEVYEIESEIIDRFGDLDEYTKNFINLSVLKKIALKQDIVNISNIKENILIEKENKEEIHLKAESKDEDDILSCVLAYVRSKEKCA